MGLAEGGKRRPVCPIAIAVSNDNGDGGVTSASILLQ